MDRVVPAVTTVATTSNILNSSLKIGLQEHNINKTSAEAKSPGTLYSVLLLSGEKTPRFP